MQLSRLRPLNLSTFIFLQIRRSLRLSVCAFCIRVEALYTLKHHPAESVTSDFFIADPSLKQAAFHRLANIARRDILCEKIVKSVTGDRVQTVQFALADFDKSR